MNVIFREFNPFDVWIWIEFSTIPSDAEKLYLQEAFDAWYYLGKLGGFNAENLQVQEEGLDLSYMTYDGEQADRSFMALMHNMGEFEYQGNWGRCWFDLGTSDALALDILINALRQLSQEFVAIETLVIGGVNADWLIPDTQETFMQY